MNRLQMIKSRLATWSIGAVVSRILSILHRYGMGHIRFSKTLFEFVRLVKQFDITPTLPVTASVLNRHPYLFQKIQKMGVEFAIHGYKHVDYTQLSPKEVREHFRHAIEIFNKHKIRWSGHRFPFLRWDEEKIDLLPGPKIEWDSSQVISWNSLNPKDFTEKAWQNYQKILRTYQPVNADDTRSLPRMRNGWVEIPVSVPDDDILVERLGLMDGELMSSIWQRMMQKVRDRGELLVLQLHPERFKCYTRALETLLGLARNQGDVWIASLGEITQWWKEKEKFSFNIEKVRPHRYRVITNSSDRATVLIQKDVKSDIKKQIPGFGVFVEEKCWEMESPVKPVIGVAPDMTRDTIGFLQEEGFAYEIMEDSNKCGYYLKHQNAFGEKEIKRILNDIRNSRFPLLRYWRWPNRCRYSLAVTGDIDNVTISDFLERFHG